MAETQEEHFDYRAFIAKHGGGTVTKFSDKHTVYAQGDTADALFYIAGGTVKVTIFSEYGKVAVIGILAAGDFFGEGCLDGQLMRNSSIAATSDSEIVRFDRAVIVRALHDDPAFAKLFVGFLLERNQKLQADLIDQLFNSSEKRLARILLTLANTGLGTQSNTITMAINQEMLATMVGTTRSRINQFMNKFRKLGYIDYNGKIEVNNSLLNLILHDQPPSDAS
jgi:CRP/FNR family cyclic AMP-dependent transcriptional regulator